jgi:acetylornithine/succinyldiaminopimelate/putrescine aminotransferase
MTGADVRATPAREDVLDLAERYVCPNRVQMLRALGVDLVVGRREGYRLWDLDGREYLDLHLNGGVFNLGHRNPELVDVLVDALQTLDIGNHHFPSVERSLLAEQLVELTPGAHYAVFASGGGEAVDLALKSARRATGRRKVVSVSGAYHGHTGLALAAGDERAAESFLSDGAPGDFVRVNFDDVEALERALGAGDVAAVILETVPATVGFPLVSPDYLHAVRRLCDEAGALYVADEVQTGLGRTGSLWGVQRAGVVPDVLVCGKGLSGGLYPLAATLLSERAGRWLQEDGWGHVSTFGGAEVGCRVGRAVLDITTRESTQDRIDSLIVRFASGLDHLQRAHPDRLLEVRQTGLVIGLRFDHPQGGMLMTKALHDVGMWAMFAGFDPSALQVKPGLLLDDGTADQVLALLDEAIATLPNGAAS